MANDQDPKPPAQSKKNETVFVIGMIGIVALLTYRTSTTVDGSGRRGALRSDIKEEPPPGGG
jgi:hypothetical protein